MRHDLKILPEYFNDVWEGKKTFEIRKNDRDYQVGDFLVLKEWEGEEYTGSAIVVEVTYIFDDAKYVKEGYVILGFKRFVARSRS